MGFEEEIAKLQRVRTVFLDFSQENNPRIVLPEGVRLYGKSYDNRGPIPIVGSVESFGSFNRALVNADWALETPTLNVRLVDLNNEWRALAVPPSHLLKYSWCHLKLRVLDDDREAYDQRIAIGQVTNPRFPSGKRVDLAMQLTGGKWMGELIPRRLITVQDFPRCALENVGKAVPIVFGVVSNLITSTDSDSTDTSSDSCSARSTIILQESFSNGSSVAFDNGGIYWEDTDPLYPSVFATEGVEVEVDGGPGPGVNVLAAADPYLGSGGTANDAYGAGAVVFRNLGADDNGSFDATQFYATFDMLHVAEALDLENFYYYPMIQAYGPEGGDGFEVTLVSEEYTGSELPAFLIKYTVWNGETEDEDQIEVQVPTSYGALQEGWWTYTVCFKCGTYEYALGEDWHTVAADGWFRVYRTPYGGVTRELLFEATDIALMVDYGEYLVAGTDSSNRLEQVAFGWYGLAGKLTGISITTGAAAEVPVTVATQNCRDTPGLSDNLVSGAMRAILIDTGTIPAANDGEASGWDADLGAPADAQANNIEGGGTITVNTYYMVAPRNVAEVGELTGVFNLGPEGASAGCVSFNAGTGDATDYIVWMFTDLSFHPETNPSPGARYKVVADPNGSPFGDFDYSVTFTSLEDGDAWIGEETPSTTDPSPRGYRYLLAGHTLSAVDQVYVLKPMPAVLDGADMNTVTVAAALGANQVQVAYESEVGPVESTVPRFSQGNLLIFAGDTTSYEVTASEEGLLTITPPLAAALTVGTAVYKAQMVDQQVLQVEGEDYEQEVQEINGNRYHTIVFYTRLQNPDTCAQYEVTCNVQGSEINADGTGTIIHHGVSVFQHFCKNWIFNDYRSSVGPYAPPGGKWFEETSYSPGLIDNDSFYAADLVTAGRIPGNYQGMGALTEQIPASQLIQELAASFDCDFYYDNSVGGNGAWRVKVFDPGTVVRADLPHYTPEDVIERDTFELEFSDSLKHANVVPYFAGPMIGRALGQSTDQSGGYMVSGQVSDPTSIATYGQLLADPLYLPWTRHAPSAYDVAYRRLLRTRYPQITATCKTAISVINDALASEVRVTHPDGLGVAGWQARVCRVLRSDIDLDSMTVTLTLLDVDDLVP